MSYWRLFMQELARADKPLPTPVGVDSWQMMAAPVKMGFLSRRPIENQRRGQTVYWTLTDLGREYLAGRVTIQHVRNRPPHGVVPVATWLRSLPPTNQVRLAGGDSLQARLERAEKALVRHGLLLCDGCGQWHGALARQLCKATDET